MPTRLLLPRMVIFWRRHLATPSYGIATSHSFPPYVLSPAGTSTNRTVSTPISDAEDVLTPVMRRLPSATRGIKRECDAIAQQIRRLSLELAPGSYERDFSLSIVVPWGSLYKKIYDMLKGSCESAREAHATLNMYHAGIFSRPRDIHIDRHVYEAFDVARSTNALVYDLQKFESAAKSVLDAHIDGVSHEIQTVKKRRVELEALYRTELEREGQPRQMGVSNIHPVCPRVSRRVPHEVI
ncbi:hypothetical protein C2E23DRAFT_420545 [Lenzites betulinus]|nr:hypothetical protein C2E23DRAFT_420545 [Lenzites betulinus]